MAVDLLAFGPHPDDVELGAGGTLAKMARRGLQVGIVDLTRGEMGSNGTPEERVREAEEAARILGCAWRRNLGLPDRGLRADPEQVRAAVTVIREACPQVVLLPYWQDRHPDHGAACRLLEEALHSAGLRRYETGQAPWRPAKTLYYFINDATEPSFLVDITEVRAQKIESVFAYRSQFGSSGTETRLNRAYGLPHLVEQRDAYFGARAGVACAEGFLAKDPPLRQHLLEW
jgi:N-acetylglucosamine malate deacetylase 1